MNKELIFLKTFAISMAFGALLLINTAFTRHGNTRFAEIDVVNHPLLPLSCFH